MKKFLCLVGMITCIFGLTACGSEETLTDYEQQKCTYAETMAQQLLVPYFCEFMDDANTNVFDGRTAEEISYLIGTNQNLGFNVDGNAVLGAISSFNSAADEIGELKEIGEAKAVIDDRQIIVTVEVKGSEKDAEAELIMSNDMFMNLESAALNPKNSLGEAMGNAALNTVIGMSTVFIILILISLIISCFNLIPKIQKSMEAKKKAKEEAGTTGIDKAVAQITANEESESAQEDDLELIAVIAAAIAASEGAASADGFVVRSIRKRKEAARW